MERLTPEQIELLKSRGDRMLGAYFHWFDSTGNEAIDLILAAVAGAGKAYHSTELWDEPAGWRNEDGPSWWDLIQAAANSAAAGGRPVTTNPDAEARRIQGQFEECVDFLHRLVECGVLTQDRADEVLTERAVFDSWRIIDLGVTP